MGRVRQRDTRAAAAGGVTTIVDMPLNSIPPTVDVEALAVKRRVAAGQAYVDVGFWGGALPGNVSDLRALHDAGLFGFKCFLLHSGVDEFPPLDPDELELALKEIASFGAMMIVHAEDAHADVAKLQHKNPVSAYDRRPLAGVVRSTWLAGKRIDLDEDPRGRLLSRGMA